MSTNENPVEPQEVDLDTFAADFFGQKTVAPEQASPESDEESDAEESDANEEDTQNPEDDTLADEDDTEDEDSDGGDEEAVEPAPKPKKNRFQERIDELTTARREAERREEKLRADFEEIKKQLEKVNGKTDPAPKVSDDGRPKPDALNEDGSAKYELGEFDPQFQADLVTHLFEQKQKEMESKAAEQAEEKAVQAQREALEAGWNEKLGPAQERYPDFMDKGQQLVDSFDGLDQAYGEYLTATLMGMEFGPDVLYYLANNPDEAKKIVNSGPTKATVALGEIHVKFRDAQQEKQKARPKVSKAPPPPSHRNKGSAAAVVDIPDDTDDLDLFSQKLFAKK
jgi:hypothetical protein